MKKWVFRIGLVVLVLVFVLVGLVLYNEMDEAIIKNYKKTDELKTVKDDWKGVPIDQKGRFVNLEYPFLPSTIDLLKWKLNPNLQAEEKENDKSTLKV